VSGNLIVGQPIKLDGTATQDPDGIITRFLWDLDGDEVYETNTGLARTTTKTFDAPAQVSFGLEVEYPFGISWSRTSPLSISGMSTAFPTGTGAPLPTPSVAAPVAAPALSAFKVRLGKLLKSGLPLEVSCGSPCSVHFALRVDGKTAKRLHLGKGKPVTIGRLTGGYAAGVTKPRLVLRAASKRILKRARSLKATLTGGVLQSGARDLKVSKLFTFKR
jgi:hypothetical protein